ncbi:down syndrome cell adhesion molecule-like protein 1 [Trichonephila clavata]|uniref:Down syndrome cell adhesion molecule-like protein 1 n=1 Tax=Trichonephila clavata TaxID=2740835 RepID=A0A8X6I1Q3_TRICU|nr:down syndrome cell adhesion molecule-like protein 1 [Trichonephila clavata]
MLRFSGGRYSILPTGELYIRGVTQADGQKSYSCQTRHRLTGEIVASASAGSLFVTGNHLPYFEACQLSTVYQSKSFNEDRKCNSLKMYVFSKCFRRF